MDDNEPKIIGRWKHWARYFKNDWRGRDAETMSKNEVCLDYLVKYLPPYIDSVLQFGCGNGRDFIPFDEKYYLYGCDLAPFDEINWIRDFYDLTYYRCAVENIRKLLESYDEFNDLSNFLVYTSGTIMYACGERQKDFFKVCEEHGCKNFIFQEFSLEEYMIRNKPFKNHGFYFMVDDKRFIKKLYRKRVPDNPMPIAHILLDIDDKTKIKIQEEQI